MSGRPEDISDSFIYAIVSDSEEGFWSNEQGWVMDIESADRWSGDKINAGVVGLPLTIGNDARYIVTNY